MDGDRRRLWRRGRRRAGDPAMGSGTVRNGGLWSMEALAHLPFVWTVGRAEMAVFGGWRRRPVAVADGDRWCKPWRRQAWAQRRGRFIASKLRSGPGLSTTRGRGWFGRADLSRACVGRLIAAAGVGARLASRQPNSRHKCDKSRIYILHGYSPLPIAKIGRISGI